MANAKTFSIVERKGYRIVDLKARIVGWGTSVQGPEQQVRLVLLPPGQPAPRLAGDLEGAMIVRTPVRRIATNAGWQEAILTELGVAGRLVAVGGPYSYDDGIRARTKAGQLAAIGYGWHSPPHLDALVASRPDILLMALGDLNHAQHLKRIQRLGIPVMPTFVDSEPTYLGRSDYIRLVGMLVGREAEADAYVAAVARNVERLKRLAAAQPKRSLMFAWYGGGDRWMATMRNADAQLFRDAGAVNPFEQPDDPTLDAFAWVGTETLLAKGRNADCWVIRDPISPAIGNRAVLTRFKAWREGCLFAIDGRTKPEHNAYDLYETAVIRPDLLLGDTVRMLHPALRHEPFRYIRPDTKEIRS